MITRPRVDATRDIEGLPDRPVQYWGFFSRDEIEGQCGQLLMMDIDFGRTCSLRCASCFRKVNPVDDFDYPDLTCDELVAVIREAKSLGLQTVKICGAGEPFESPELMGFLRELAVLGVGCAVFTKGHVLGDDELTRKYFGGYGIHDARDLCCTLFELPVSILLSFQSFSADIQDELVGGVQGHTERRDRALALLVETGFSTVHPTRLALCTNPLTRSNYGELFDLYVYGRERNLYPVITPLMVSGKQTDRDFLAEVDVSPAKKIELWTRVYSYNIENGIQTLEQLRRDGLSSMAGIHHCNQIACGVYLTMNGTVISCPGDSKRPFGNVREHSLKDIWESCHNRDRAGTFNCWCPPKEGVTLPPGLSDRVLEGLEKRYG